MRDEEDVDHIYKLTAQNEDWINPIVNGVLYREKDSEFFFDSDGEMENWKNRLDDVSMLRCLQIRKNFGSISSEVRDLPYFDSSGNVRDFL